MTSEEAKKDLLKQIAEAKKKFAERAALTENNKTQAVTNACLRTEGTAKRLMRATYTALTYTNPKTGNVVVNKRPRSIPGSAPAPDDGTLMRSTTHNVEVHFGEAFGRVGSTIKNPPYPAYLEDGTTKMAARPWLFPALSKSTQYFKADIEACLKDKALLELSGGGE
jgi:hypothetical protein